MKRDDAEKRWKDNYVLAGFSCRKMRIIPE